MTQGLREIAIVNFPTLENVKSVEDEQPKLPAGWQPYQAAIDLLAQSFNFTDRWDQPHVGWIEFNRTRTYAGPGPIEGEPVREALIGLVEADEDGTLNPPLNESLRGLLGTMKTAIDAELDRRLDGYDADNLSLVRARYLEIIDKEWFKWDGDHRAAVIAGLQLAVHNGIVTPIAE